MDTGVASTHPRRTTQGMRSVMRLSRGRSTGGSVTANVHQDPNRQGVKDVSAPASRHCNPDRQITLKPRWRRQHQTLVEVLNKGNLRIRTTNHHAALRGGATDRAVRIVTS